MSTRGYDKLNGRLGIGRVTANGGGRVDDFTLSEHSDRKSLSVRTFVQDRNGDDGPVLVPVPGQDLLHRLPTARHAFNVDSAIRSAVRQLVRPAVCTDFSPKFVGGESNILTRECSHGPV